MVLDVLVLVMYALGMLILGWFGMRRSRTHEDFLVAGRNLGPGMYMGTMAATVLGGASTVGSVRLPSKNVESMQMAALFAQTMAALRPSTRRAFLLYRLGGCSHPQIARRMGISVSMVEKHVMTAMAALHSAGIDGRSRSGRDR